MKWKGIRPDLSYDEDSFPSHFAQTPVKYFHLIDSKKVIPLPQLAQAQKQFSVSTKSAVHT